MKRVLVYIYLLMFLILLIMNNCAKKENSPLLKGPYFGQKPPGMVPEVFAPQILENKNAFCSVFSPDGNEFFYVGDVPGGDEGDILWMRRVNDVWTRPEAAPFNSSFCDNDICISAAGDRVFFRSWRPIPGSDKKEENSSIWYAEKIKNSWSEAKPVKCGDTILKAGYPAIVKNGTLYFPYRSKDNVGESDIHLSRLTNGAYGTPENLGSSINTKYIEGDMCVAQDESFLIVSCWYRPDNNGESDLYISFRKENGAWSALKNMGKLINSEANENCPMISPDGKYFFFFKYNPVKETTSTYWVDAKIIEELKPKNIKK